ncbi:hypothetical protein Tco_0992868 [Tanacetum coccineum]|uniref:NLP1-9 GAF domain-containing protein n=1 Tax=Tanacetum coccineum TaxID=301880 RepID=A0ABQ5F4G5_9ASTR
MSSSDSLVTTDSVTISSFDFIFTTFSIILIYAFSDNGIRFLSCSDQPFALEEFDPRHHFYRLCSIKVRCNIDRDDNYVPKPDVKDWIIDNSPFLNRFPDVVLDLRSLRGTPLVEVALRCGFTSLILLPVFDHNSSCVGVVECCMKRAGLSTYHVQDSLPFETIPGLKLATYEIEVALKTLCDSHQLSLAQVWIANNSEKHAPCSSSLEVTQTKQKIAVKLSGYCTDPLDDHLPMTHINEYYDTCNVLPLKIREVSIVRKTLETNQPHFCKNINKLMVNGPLGYLLGLGQKYSIVLESQLLNLRRCLPSFKFASSQELGGELRVVDFQNSTGSGVGSFEVLKLEQGMVMEEDDLKQQHQDALEKIKEAFMLDPETYTLEYQFEENWFKLDTSVHLAGLRQCYRKDPNCRLKVFVLPSSVETNGLVDQQHAQ